MQKDKKGGSIEKVELNCNCCGKQIIVERGIIKEGTFVADISWGYFSRKDGEKDSFTLCEDCYDDFVGKFSIPVKKATELELI
ncbi:MAG: hypothetical protein GX913_03180 [Clostridiales bacterium]|nr:hypothetical protein [Clostridiales bacterium]